MEYQLLQSSWQSSRISLLEKVETRYPKRLEEIQQTLELYEEDRQLVAEELSKEFSIELQGTIYTEKKALDVFNQLLPAPTDGTQKRNRTVSRTSLVCCSFTIRPSHCSP